MAKGDHRRAQNAITSNAPRAQANTNNLNTNLQNSQKDFYNNYQTGVQKDFNSYDDIMGRYQSMYNQASQPGGGYGWDPQFRGAVSSAIGGYGDFANTGGFSQQNIQDIRARGIAPTRAVYENAQSNIDRQRSLQGGYSPNYTASTAKLTRDLANSIGDQNTNVNAQIGQMVQQGRLAGLAGLSNTGIGAQNADTGINELNARNQQALLSGMTNLYGTAPGLIGTTGNQLNTANSNLIAGQTAANNLDLGIMDATNNLGRNPGNLQQGLQNASTIAGLVGNVSGAGMGGFGGIGGGSALGGIGGGGGTAIGGAAGTGAGLTTGGTAALGGGSAIGGAAGTGAGIATGAGTPIAAGSAIGGGSAVGAGTGIGAGSSALGAGSIGGGATAGGIGSGASSLGAGAIGGGGTTGGSAAAGGAGMSGGALAGTIASYAGGAAAPFIIGELLNPTSQHYTPYLSPEQAMEAYNQYGIPIQGDMSQVSASDVPWWTGLPAGAGKGENQFSNYANVMGRPA